MYYLLVIALMLLVCFAWQWYLASKEDRELDQVLKKWVQWKQDKEREDNRGY